LYFRYFLIWWLLTNNEKMIFQVFFYLMIVNKSRKLYFRYFLIWWEKSGLARRTRTEPRQGKRRKAPGRKSSVSSCKQIQNETTKILFYFYFNGPFILPLLMDCLLIWKQEKRHLFLCYCCLPEQPKNTFVWSSFSPHSLSTSSAPRSSLSDRNVRTKRRKETSSQFKRKSAPMEK
jgi:hypothetical protein